MKNTLFDINFLNKLIYWYWAWKPNFFIIKKFVFFFNISNRPNRLNRTAIGQKTDPRRCASVPIMKKPISIGSVINLEKNHHYRTAHTTSHSCCFHERSLYIQFQETENWKDKQKDEVIELITIKNWPTWVGELWKAILIWWLVDQVLPGKT